MRKTLVFLSLTFVFVLMILTSCGSGVKGTYYEWDEFRQELEKDYSIIFGSKNEWSDTDGFSGTYELDGSNITLYVEVMGFTEVLCSGTIGNGKFEYVSLGSTYTYYKEGFEPKKEETKEPTVSLTEDEPTLPDESTKEPTLPEVVEYTVKFDSDGGTQISDRIVEAGSKVNAPSEPLKTGYIFDGWYYGDTKWNFNNVINGNITLKAKWLENTSHDNEEYLVDFCILPYYNETTYVKWGQKVARPEDPVRNGYVFLGWYSEGYEFNFDQKIFGETYISAEWKLDESVITYNNMKLFLVNNEYYEIIEINLTNETEIVIPAMYNNKPIKSIGDAAIIEHNEVLESVIIEADLFNIGAYTFGQCENLKSVNLPRTLKKIGTQAFSFTKIEEIVIPESVEEWGDFVFLGSEIKCAILPTNMKEIPKGMFAGCKNLENIILPNTITRIGVCAFEGCKGLTTINIPEGVVEIGGSAFDSCENLESITLPSTLTAINDFAFFRCYKLTKIYNDSNLILESGSSENGYIAYYVTEIYNKGEWEYIEGIPSLIK